MCLQRDAGDEVLGCDGDITTDDTNYCVYPYMNNPPLIDYGSSSIIPPDFYPLRLCEGNCNNDDECGEGLICEEREVGDLALHCTGDFDATSSNFCVLIS